MPRQAISEQARQRVLTQAARLVAPEKPDVVGAITALLVMVAIERLHLKADSPQISRLKAIAMRVHATHGEEVPTAASALRMVDEMLQLSVEDYQRVQAAQPSVGPVHEADGLPI